MQKVDKPTQSVRISPDAGETLMRIKTAIRATSGFTMTYTQIVGAALFEYERLVNQSVPPATPNDEPPPLAAVRPLPRQQYKPSPKPR